MGFILREQTYAAAPALSAWPHNEPIPYEKHTDVPAFVRERGFKVHLGSADVVFVYPLARASANVSHPSLPPATAQRLLPTRHQRDAGVIGSCAPSSRADKTNKGSQFMLPFVRFSPPCVFRRTVIVYVDINLSL